MKMILAIAKVTLRINVTTIISKSEFKTWTVEVFM